MSFKADTNFLAIGGTGGGHVDPWSFTTAQVRAIRGAIWPTRAPVQFGPRPGQPDNIYDSGAFYCYSDADHATGIAATLANRYTHVQVGPFAGAGYHGQYPDFPLDDFLARPDWYADRLQAFYDAGLIVVIFIKPDGWDTDARYYGPGDARNVPVSQLRVFEPIFTQPRWQALARYVSVAGWEPGEDTPNACHVAWQEWGARIFPRALRALHLPTDFDAPGNNDDLTPGTPRFIGMPQCWANVVPYLHAYFIQNGPYTTAPDANPTLRDNFANQFRPAARGSLWQRFHQGYAGWPTCSAYGPTTPIDLIACEETSYEAYWRNLAERASQQWGDVALAAGADGAFDGCFAR